MKTAVQIQIGFSGDWQDMATDFGVIKDFEQAIRIVRSSGIKNVQLRQDSLGLVMQWDNF
jgi:hypothetical protein